VPLFENVDTSDVQQAWDARFSALEKLSSPRIGLTASFKRAKERGVDGDASGADPKHLGQLDISDGAWVDRELKSKLDELDAAMGDVRSLQNTIQSTEAQWQALVQATTEARDTLGRSQAKAKADLKRNLKWAVIFVIVFMIFRTCAS
jgi:hypothetical protein